jgi:spore coat polysaccharide biosynthesis predicted glycosyltransferase SpsG
MQLDLTSLSILFVAAASNKIGFGHLNRCLSLAIYAQKIGADISFLVFGTASAKTRIIAAGFSCAVLEESKMHTVDWAQSDRLQADVVITDLLFPGFFEASIPSTLFCHLRNLGKLLVAIDVLGEESVIGKPLQMEVDIVVSPYVMPCGDIQEMPWRYLRGPEYALLGAEYASLPPRIQRTCANRLLVSCGGSDPNRYTLKVLLGLEAVPQALDIHVIAGPLSHSDLHTEVENLATRSRHQITLLTAPLSLLNEMIWCDLAICASGLTKYELAASATPALLFSIDAHHDLVNRPFIFMQTAIDLGVGISSERIALETSRLLGSVALRRAMAKYGRMLIDGRGAERLFSEIKKELSC